MEEKYAKEKSGAAIKKIMEGVQQRPAGGRLLIQET